MLKKTVLFGLKALGVELRRFPLFRRSIDLLMKSGRKPYFIQIGANNGIDFDDFYSVVSAHELPGLVVEPIPYYFEALAQVYKCRREIVPVKVAIHPTEQEATIYRVDPDKVTVGWQHGLGSFSRDHLINARVPAAAIIEERVPCMSLPSLVDTYVPKGETVDILVTDAEGFDGEILAMVDFDVLKPKVIKFESESLAPSARAEIEVRLKAAGYLVYHGVQDTVAVNAALASSLRYFIEAMR